MLRCRSLLARWISALVLLVPLAVTFNASHANAETFSALTLQNGWFNAPFGTRGAGLATVTDSDGIVYLKGAIATGGTNPVPFTLPVGDRPTANVYVPVDLCTAHNGRLFIQPNGVVTVQAETAFSNAQCFVSLEGVSFSIHVTGFNPLTLRNGWTNAPFGTSNAGVGLEDDGIVHLKGAIATGGTNPVAFTLPVGVRPATNVYVPVDLCNRHNGRLFIQPNGVVTVQAETAFSNAQCFTSLEGVSFAANVLSFTPLTLQNGWTNAPFGTSNAAVANAAGTLYFKGAIATGGTNPVPFTLPVGDRPTANVYVPVDLCTAHNGRLFIQPNGVVTVQAETAFSNAQCFTSLDGVSFAVSIFTPVMLLNGWINNGAYYAGAVNVNGIVHLRGVIRGADTVVATNSGAFILPVGFRPATDVYVPIDFCLDGAAPKPANKGRLFIQASGLVTVGYETADPVGACPSPYNQDVPVSLDGVSFALNATGFTPLTLQNGWTNAPFLTSNAAAKNIGGILYLKGAIATGSTNPVPFTLPVGDRPATNVYVPVDLCNRHNGRLFIQPNGVVTVQAETGFSNAQCFTSLDGVAFALNATGFTPLTLQNGWTNAPFGTSNAAVRDVGGILYFKGAIHTTGIDHYPFELPTSFWLSHGVLLNVDLCSATMGELGLLNFGVVQAETSFANAQCFTSLDGVSVAR